MADIDALVAELREEYLRLSARSLDRGCPDSGIAANLAEKAADALQCMERDRNGWRKIVGDIAALVPLPSVIKATGTTGDLIEWIKEQVARAEAERSKRVRLEEALRRLLSLCEQGGDPFDEPGRPTVMAARSALSHSSSKGESRE